MFNLFNRKPPAPPQPSIGANLRRDQLVPRLKHVHFVRALEQAGVPPAQRPAIMPLCGDLLVTYAFDLPDTFMMASPALLEQTGIAPAEVAQLAIENLGRQMSEPQFMNQDGCGVAHTGDNLEATLLLLDGVWAGLQSHIRGELLAAVPRRDRLLVCDSANADATRALPGLAAAYFAEHEDQHALSTQIMVRRGGNWTLYAS